MADVYYREVKWVQQELIRCGKARCKSCPHGPYWYAYTTDENHRQRKHYLGKVLPPELHDLAATFGRGPKIADQRTAAKVTLPKTEPLTWAESLLGIHDGYSRDRARKQFWNRIRAKSRSQVEKLGLLHAWRAVCHNRGWDLGADYVRLAVDLAGESPEAH